MAHAPAVRLVSIGVDTRRDDDQVPDAARLNQSLPRLFRVICRDIGELLAWLWVGAAVAKLRATTASQRVGQAGDEIARQLHKAWPPPLAELVIVIQDLEASGDRTAEHAEAG